jgi:hypothetical protein
LFVHFLSLAIWVGGGISAMALAIWSRKLTRPNLPPIIHAIGVLYRALLLPGSLATVVSGIVLTLMIYGGPAASHGLMMMQATGLIAALITLLVLSPNVARLGRIDPVEDAARFDLLRARQARFGMLSGLLLLLALLGGALARP